MEVFWKGWVVRELLVVWWAMVVWDVWCWDAVWLGLPVPVLGVLGGRARLRAGCESV